MPCDWVPLVLLTKDIYYLGYYLVCGRVSAGALELADHQLGEESEAIAKRDALIRRVAADNSPDNANREKVFGKAAFARTKALLCGELDACE